MERTLFADLTEIASHTNSVVEMESARHLALELSNQSALVTVTVVSENSAVIINASQNHNFAALSSVATLVPLTETATVMSSVVETESARSSALELSHHSALTPVTVAMMSSAILLMNVSHSPLLCEPIPIECRTFGCTTNPSIEIH